MAAAAAAASSSSTTRRPFRDLSLRHKAFFSKPSSFGVSFPPHSRPKAALLRFSSSSSSSSQVTSSCHPKADVVTKDMWDKSILNSELPVLVEFYASWCGPCGMVQRVMDEIAEEYAGKVRCFILNTDHDLQVAEDYAIKAVPVVMLFKNGKRCDSVIGTMPKDYYVAAINRIMES